MKNQQTILSKYVNLYAERDIEHLSNFHHLVKFQHVVVIPVYKESSAFIKRFLTTFDRDERILAIVVVNQPNDDSNKQPQQLLVDEVIGLGEIAWKHKNYTLVTPKNSRHGILLIDAFTTGLPRENGVGLARKIGCDTAVCLMAQQVIQSSWIHSTDADATLPSNYFSGVHSVPSSVKIGYCRFNHQCDDITVHQATAQYELALRYYVSGLRYANSTYAFFTIGSLLIFNVDAYCQVRGFPKKSAGEDFYLINKMAKVGDVTEFSDISVTLEARTSDRVPFGTGPAVSKIIALENNENFHYYHPHIFELLKQWLVLSDDVYHQRDNIEHWLNTLPKSIAYALHDIQFARFVEKQRHANKQQFTKQFHVWFDAFKTLKFLHAIRDFGFPDIPLMQGISQANFTVAMSSTT